MSLAISQTSGSICYLGEYNIYFIDIENKSKKLMFKGHVSFVENIIFSKNYKYAILNDCNRTVLILNYIEKLLPTANILKKCFKFLFPLLLFL